MEQATEQFNIFVFFSLSIKAHKSILLAENFYTTNKNFARLKKILHD
jgi:hypothetical protein